MGIRDRIDDWRYERDYSRIRRGTQIPTVSRNSQRRRFYLGVVTLVFLAAAVTVEWVGATSRPQGILGVVLAGGLALGAYLGGKEGWAGRHLGTIRMVVVFAYLALVAAVGIKLFWEA